MTSNINHAFEIRERSKANNLVEDYSFNQTT